MSCSGFLVLKCNSVKGFKKSFKRADQYFNTVLEAVTCVMLSSRQFYFATQNCRMVPFQLKIIIMQFKLTAMYNCWL